MTDETNNTYDGFFERFTKLQQEAKQYGIASLLVLHEINPIGEMTRTGVAYEGGLPLCIGLAKVSEAELTRWHLHSQEAE